MVYKRRNEWNECPSRLDMGRKKQKDILPRLLNYFSFVFSSFVGWILKLRKADYLLCESPPLFLGISAVFLKRIKKAKLIFNVADLWPESAEKLGLITNKTLLKITTRLEEYPYKSSALITGTNPWEL